MKILIHVNNANHQKQHAAAMKQGLERHGISVSFCVRADIGESLLQDPVFTEKKNRPALKYRYDAIVIWGCKPPGFVKTVKDAGMPILVMERGYLPDRFVFSSLGWNGLNNRATFAPVDDSGARFNKLWPGLLKPWKEEGGEYVLLCGQVPGDAALYGMDLDRWAQDMTNELVNRQQERVVFRPHPYTVLRNQVRVPRGATLSTAPTLLEDLAKAKKCVTFNSNAGVEAVYFGTPTCTLDEGAMAWPVSTHKIHDKPIRPDREQWAHRLAWCNWNIEEIQSGYAWEHIRQAMNKGDMSNG